MSDTEWWETEAQVEDVEPGPKAELQPKEASDAELYHMPDRITAKWVRAQLPESEWREVTKHQKNINHHTIEYMCKLAKKGLPNAVIMARSGHSPQLWKQWEKRAAMGEEPYALWYKCVMYSRSHAEERLWDEIRGHGASDWKATKWLLEQSNKQEYGPEPKGQTINISGDVNQEQSVNYMSDQDALQVARIMKQIGALPSAEVVEGEVVEDNDSDSRGA